MAENTLDVRLLHAAKTLDDWNNVTTIPKLGEVCLEIQGNTPPLNYKIKIGDGSSTYAALPYFGTVVNTSGNASVVVVDTVTDGSVTRKVLKFYKFTLTTSTVNGVTTITPTIGDLILTVQEGDGINFSTNTTDTLVNVELEATTADTAQTIADGGTFTTITKDSNNRATKYTTFTLPSITSKINALDVADNTVITSEWDSTNKQIKLYYVKETDGIIQKGSLAYTINATDIAPVQNITTTDTGNSGLDITISNNVKDVHHKAVTQNIIDNSNPAEEKELDIITNVNVDSYGHITGYTKDKSTNLVAADIKAPVRQSDDSMWNHRVTGGTINIGEEIAKISKLRGNTLVWNQLVNISTSSVTLISQHKYYTVISGTKSIQTGAGSAISVTGGTDVVVNLTKMFGTGNEPTTVEEFERLFPIEYAPYCEGRLVSLGGYKIKWNQLNPDNVKSQSIQSTGSRVLATDGSTQITFTENHFYYFSAKVKTLTASDQSWLWGGSVMTIGVLNYTHFTRIAQWNGTTTTRPNNFTIVGNYNNDSSVTGEVGYQDLIIVDLTEMFGPGSEPTLEEFEAMFPADYYEYNAGTEMNIFDAIGDKKLGLESTGFNQWDEEWEVGTIVSGTPSPSTTAIRSKNFCPCLPNTQYHIKGPNTMYVFFYDKKHNYISYIEGSDDTRTSPNNAAFFKVNNRASSTYNYDICINLSDSSRNGTYEPYKESTLDLSWIQSIKDSDGNQLFPYGLLSTDSVHDEIGDNYAIKRVGSVDLGSLTWSFNSTNNILYVNNFTEAVSKESSIPSNLLTSKWLSISDSQALSKIGIYLESSSQLGIHDTSYSTQSAFEDAVQGVMLYYELVEPVTVYFDKKPMTYPVDDLGTETLLPQGVDSTIGVPLSAPFNGTFEYKSNFKDTILDLINKVNNARNPVKGVTNTNQTVDKLAIYDSVETVKSSNYSPSNATIVEGATDNGIILPSVETIVNYVNSKLSSALTYKGTISQWSDLPTSGQSVGDMYIADTTFTEDDVTYQAGDFFIWNGTDWDIVSGTTSVVNSNPTLTPNGNTYQVGTVDGRPLQVTTPNLNYPSSPISSVGQSIDFIDTVSQTNGLVNATKKAIPSARTIVNGTNYDILVPLSASLWSSIYAPTTAGTNGQFLKSTAGTPIWATLGIGDLGLYSKNLKQNLNGQDTNLGNIIRNSNEDLNLPAFYAPLNAGTAYNLLISNGSGAPSWTTFLSTDNGYLKKTANGGWSLDPYGGGAKESVMNDGSVITASSSATAGLRKQTGSSNYEYQKISFAAITNDTATGNNAVTIILNGNFS